MQVGNSSPGIPLTIARADSLSIQLPMLQAGQILEARVLEIQKDGLLLQLLNHEKPVLVQTSQTLQAGQQIRLLVSLDHGRIQLHMLDEPEENPALKQGWRDALPRQQALEQTLQQLARFIQSGKNLQAATRVDTMAERLAQLAQAIKNPSQAGLPAAGTTATADTPPADTGNPLRSQIVELLARLSIPQNLGTADGLRQAVSQSGLFLEARLAQGDTSTLSGDFRAALLRVLASLRNEQAAASGSIPAADRAGTALLQQSILQELTQGIEGALARIKVQQLQTLHVQQSGPDPAWLLELPLRMGQEHEVLRMRIQREGGENHTRGAAGWSVRLHFENVEYGPVDSVITLLGGKIGVSFWAERAATASRFQERMEELRSQLQQAGLEVEHLRSLAGRATLADEPVPDGLLNLSV